MPGQAINATLDLEGLEVIGVVASGDLIELVVESRFDAGAFAVVVASLQNPRSGPKSWCAIWRSAEGPSCCGGGRGGGGARIATARGPRPISRSRLERA
jgi:hypothetical protein